MFAELTVQNKSSKEHLSKSRTGREDKSNDGGEVRVSSR